MIDSIFNAVAGLAEQYLLSANRGAGVGNAAGMFDPKYNSAYIVLVAIIGIPTVLVSIVALFKDKKLAGYYKSTNLFGRFYSLLAVDAVLGGFVGFISGVFSVISGGVFAKSGWLTLGISIAVLVLGAFLYIRVQKKAPEFLKKRSLWDLTLCGLGTTLRVSLFMIAFIVGFGAWFAGIVPEKYELMDGRTVDVYPDGRVYDPYNGRLGKASEDRKTVVWDA